jgi:hypothetical protein
VIKIKGNNDLRSNLYLLQNIEYSLRDGKINQIYNHRAENHF